jgi:uncharacterized protein YjbK
LKSRSMLLVIMGLFFSVRASASEAVFCSGKIYAIEVLVSISTGEIFDVFMYEKRNEGTSETQTNISLETKSIDYKKRKISISGVMNDEKHQSLTFTSQKKKGVLNYHGRHKLACDWSEF